MGKQDINKVKEVKQDDVKELTEKNNGLEQELDKVRQEKQQVEANLSHFNEVVKSLKEKLGNKDITITSHEVTIKQLQEGIKQLQEKLQEK